MRAPHSLREAWAASCCLQLCYSVYLMRVTRTAKRATGVPVHENVEIEVCFSSRMRVNGSLMNNSDELSPQTRKLE